MPERTDPDTSVPADPSAYHALNGKDAADDSQLTPGAGDDDEDLYVDPDTCYHLHERLVLKDGTEHIRRGAMFASEPHLGDVMDTSGFRIIHLLAQAKEDGYLRWVSDVDGLFFTPYENISGIFVDVLTPDGDEVPGDELKPGRWKPADE